jgi:hypothetical protein
LWVLSLNALCGRQINSQRRAVTKKEGSRLVGLGSLLFGEPLSMRMMAATVVVVLGVFLIVSASSPEPQRRVHHPMTSGHGHVARIARDESAPRT